ncbi:hypothetical protein [uncultured Zhongshania sp.]|uniref:hypothetical protein n=1 Tax=uncultured Zhongshania sp. TaxID=1642288 RepID=UPI0025EAC93F|nr:hypothetical protein [uncultured Zhongshania sp.]
MKPRTTMLPRHAAGSFELKEGTGPITGMQSCGEFLEIYKVDKTFRVKSPESIDPEETNPNAMWVTSPTDDVGTGNPIVARSFLQNCEMLKSAIFEQEIDKDEVIMTLHSCKEALITCDKICSKVTESVLTICKAIEDSGVERDNHGRGLNPFPQVEQLDNDCGNFLVQANRVIKMLSGLPSLFLPLSKADSNFDYLAKRIESEAINAPRLLEFVKDNAKGVKYLAELRNFHEHPKKIKTIINNFTLTPNSSIEIPTWHLTGEEKSPIHEDMKATINFLLELIEITFIHTVMASLSKKYPFVIQREEKIDEANPIQYRLTFDVGQFNVE